MEDIKMPKVSAILPVYNVDKYLRKSLDSLINQTLQDIEIICVNDGSPDNSKEILKEYSEKDSRIVVIEQENMGSESARAAGLNVAKGEFIHFFDPDDSAQPDMYEKTYKAAIESNADFVIFGAAHILSDGSVNQNWKDGYTSRNTGLVNIENDKPYFGMLVCLWNKLFRKSIIDKYDIKFPYNTKIKIGYDEVFTFMYLTASKTVYAMPDKFYHYYSHPNSLMDGIYKKESLPLDVWYCFEELYKYIEKRSLGQDVFDGFLKRYGFATALYYDKYLDLEHKKKALKLVSDFLPTIDPKYGNKSDIMSTYFSYLLKL